MKCVMTRGIYLRANGRLPCYCGAGETITLERLPIKNASFSFVEDYYKKGLFRHIRDKMSKGMVPFPGICDQCTYLEPENDIETDRNNSELEWLHWEPSSLCMLDCQWCSIDRRKYNKTGQNRLLPFELFKNIVTDLCLNNYELKFGNICGVGEPTMHPKIWEMIRLTKELIGGNILLSTNGNGPCSKDIVLSGLDKIKIAVDAVNQKAYEQYRKNGSLKKAISFTRAIADDKKLLNSEGPTIIWQYILFNHNDSDEDLITYQKMAEDNGVDQLRIVYTRCTNYSTRSPDDFPKHFPNIIFFPIGRDSQMDIDEVEQRWSNIVSLSSGNELEDAGIEAIKFLNSIYHRLALGVETYTDLLSFTQGVHHLQGKNFLTLTSAEFQEFTHYIQKTFSMLIDIYQEMGHPDQSESYRKYVKQIHLEPEGAFV